MENIREIIILLSDEYGPVTRPDSPPEPVDELVMTILSQNTSDTNTNRAFASLKRTFPDWRAVIDADVEGVVEAIRIGGLANQKAPRIQKVLKDILDERGDFDLWFLKDLSIEDANAWLTRLSGVGPKTAACVLLFSLDKPVMPVDTHVHRVSLRLGIVPAGTTAEQAHAIVGTGLTTDETYQAHMLLIRHGRQTCVARRPACSRCVLREKCPSADLFQT